jgi:hypothetical protein
VAEHAEEQVPALIYLFAKESIDSASAWSLASLKRMTSSRSIASGWH